MAMGTTPPRSRSSNCSSTPAASTTTHPTSTTRPWSSASSRSTGSGSTRFASPPTTAIQLGAPGAQYAYSDTGYVLLGDLIERATSKSLAAAYRDLLHFDQLGLDQTWLESVEPEPAGTADRAHQFYEDLDTYDADPSFDLYGGGGLVSTVRDLATFYRALLTGGVFADPATLTVMTTVPAVSSDAGAGMGLFSFDGAELGMCWSHSGFWGSAVITCPERDFTFAVSIFQASPDPPFEGDALLRRAAELAFPGDG